MTPDGAARRLSMLRDPLSKTLLVSMVGIVSLTLIALAVIAGAIAKGNLSDGATVGLIGTIVGGISTCITAVSSRAQGAAPAPSKAPPVSDV